MYSCRPGRRRRVLILPLLWMVWSVAAVWAQTTESAPPAEAAMEASSEATPSLLERRRQARGRAVAGFTHLRQGEVEQAHIELTAAVDGWPQHVQFVYGLATCEARLDQGEAALDRLEDLVRRGYTVPFAQDAAFASLRESKRFAALEEAVHGLQARRVGHEDVVFELPDRRMIPEAVAFDEVTGSYFVSSIHQRKIVRRSAEGQLTTLLPSETLWSVSGLAVDGPRRLLWAGTGALPNMQGFRPEDAGKTALVAFDLDSGKEVLRFQRRTEGHRLADLTVAADGTVFVSDAAAVLWTTVPEREEGAGDASESATDAVWQRVSASSPKGTTPARTLPSGLEIISPPELLRSPQGLAVSEDQRLLFVADYSYGISVWQRDSGHWFYLEEPEGVALFGIDGLHVMNGALIAIQNGSRPQRILRLWPDVPARRIVRSEVVAMNLPSWSEPTLGTVLGEDLIYVANSQWDRFDADGGLPPSESLAMPRILRWSSVAEEKEPRP